jgi:hypothetical protein
MEEKIGSKWKDSWWPRKGIIVFFRGKQREDGVGSYEFEQEDTERGATKEESREESQNREDLAMVCFGEQPKMLM